jgi:hypothetical protein
MANMGAPTRALSKELTAELDSCVSLSAEIRLLASKGWKRGDISRTLSARKGRNVRYQHVRNVLITPLKSA